MSKKAAPKIAAQSLRLTLPAGKATRDGQITKKGQVGSMGSKGLNVVEFCKQFNEKTKEYKPGTPVPLDLLIKPDRTFQFATSLPPVSFYLKQACSIEKGSPLPKKINVGQLTLRHVLEIAKLKKQDVVFSEMSLEKVVSSILGTARSMGIKVVDNSS